MPLKNTRKADHSRTRMARTEKELKAEQGAKHKPKKVALSVKVAKTKVSNPEQTERRPANEMLDSRPETPAKQPVKDFGELVERQKRFIILSGVTFFMVVIAVLWVFSVSASLKASRAELSAKSEGQDQTLDDLTGELGEELEKIKGELGDISEVVPSATLGTSQDQDFAKSPAVLGGLPISSTTPAVAGTSTVITPDIVEKLKEKLE